MPKKERVTKRLVAVFNGFSNRDLKYISGFLPDAIIDAITVAAGRRFLEQRHGNRKLKKPRVA